ncbi:inositol monophosphatase family protein [Chloroflexota bacterium]
MDRCLDVAIQAARQAGEFLRASLKGENEVGYKGRGHFNPFSQIDKGAEGIILDILGGAFPGHRFISEERGKTGADSDYTWVIDPLDGTVNYIHGYRLFSVSIALLCHNDVILGVIYNPLTEEMFTATRGGGAFLNGKAIRVSETASLDKSLLGTGFPYDRNSEAFLRSIRNFVHLLKVSQSIRRDGSTALDLCNVTCGRYDAFSITGNEVWDYAAGIILVAEAGGRVTDFEGNPFHIYSDKNELLATNGRIHEAILQCLAEERAT